MGVEVSHDQAVLVGEQVGDGGIVASSGATAGRWNVNVYYSQIFDLDGLSFHVWVVNLEIHWREIDRFVD